MFSIDFDTAHKFADTIFNVTKRRVSIVNHDSRLIYGGINISIEYKEQYLFNEEFFNYKGYTIIPFFHATTLICYICMEDNGKADNSSDVYYIKYVFKMTYENYIMGISKFAHADRSILINRIVSSKSKIVSAKGEYDVGFIKELVTSLGYDISIERAACLIQFPYVNTIILEDNALYDYMFSSAEKKVRHKSSQDIYGMLDNDKLLVLKTVNTQTDLSSRDILISYAEDISNQIYKNNGIKIKIGIGSIYSDLHRLQRSFDESSSMLETLYGTSKKESIAFVQDNIGKYILQNEATSELNEYFTFLSNRLDNNPLLLETITALVSNDMNIIKTADALGVHRNTISVRLEKIKQSLGIDPLNFNKDRSLFYLFSLFLDSKITLRFGINIQKTNPQYTGCFEFARLVREMSDNKINISISTAVSVGYKRQMADAVAAGTLDFVMCGMYHMGEYTGGKSHVLDLPFLFADDSHAERVLDGLPGKIVADEMEKLGIVCLGYWTQGWRVISNDSRIIRTPYDAKGLKIRIRDNMTTEECFKAFGTQPLKLGYSDLLSALKQKIIDGQDNPYINFYTMGFGKYQRYITETKHHYDINVMLASKSTMDKLTVSQRDLIIEAAKLAQKSEREQVRKMNSEAKDLIMAEGKTKIEVLTSDERKQWINRVEYLHKCTDHKDLLNIINSLSE